VLFLAVTAMFTGRQGAGHRPSIMSFQQFRDLIGGGQPLGVGAAAGVVRVGSNWKPGGRTTESGTCGVVPGP